MYKDQESTQRVEPSRSFFQRGPERDATQLMLAILWMLFQDTVGHTETCICILVINWFGSHIW